MKTGDKVKVHFYFNGVEFKTNASDKVFEVYENGGRLGIDWTEFTPFEGFAQTVIFENVETGRSYYYSNIGKCLVPVEV